MDVFRQMIVSYGFVWVCWDLWCDCLTWLPGSEVNRYGVLQLRASAA
jgi:hypothetical protein